MQQLKLQGQLRQLQYADTAATQTATELCRQLQTATSDISAAVPATRTATPATMHGATSCRQAARASSFDSHDVGDSHEGNDGHDSRDRRYSQDSHGR